MNKIIPHVNVILRGFTVKELKVIMKAIRNAEDHDPLQKIALVFIDDQTLSKEEAAAIIREIWPK